jgi:hypothetical protein
MRLSGNCPGSRPDVGRNEVRACMQGSVGTITNDWHQYSQNSDDWHGHEQTIRGPVEDSQAQGNAEVAMPAALKKHTGERPLQFVRPKGSV